jgi:hypothetical protein
MSKRRPYIGNSEAQANAEALMRRSAPFTAAADASVRVAWDWRKRQPRDLREAVDMARQLHAAEVPSKLHEGPDSIGPDGTPKMTARAEGYIFGSGTSDDAPRNPETNERDPVGYYHAPFRARLAEMSAGMEVDRKRAAIVQHVTIGARSPVEAAIAEGVPSWCARLVAEDALRAFLHSMSDMKFHLPAMQSEAVTAA